MAMAVDSRQHPQHFSTMGYPYQQNPAPQFSNPWGTAAPGQTHMYQTSLPQANDYKSNVSAYTASQMPASIYGSSAAAAYTSAPAAMSTYAPTSAPQYQSSYGYATDRRTSHPLHNVSEQDRQSFSDALDASRGMVAMSQSDITPRNIYGGASNRSSTDAYGFPGAHSSHSSISSASTYPTYYNSSVSEASTGDYASSNDGNDIMSSRILPRPNTLVGGALPPAPQSMMGQFSSKVSSSSQKKHKCKVCDKRFTRPSSLQTHMYSHTGEKPFACDVAGCGRNFSVVSNLRRHRKVHKGEGRDHSSPEDDEE